METEFPRSGIFSPSGIHNSPPPVPLTKCIIAVFQKLDFFENSKKIQNKNDSEEQHLVYQNIISRTGMLLFGIVFVLYCCFFNVFGLRVDQ